MTTNPESTDAARRVTWKIDGPAVEDGTIPVDYVVRVLTALQGAVRRVAESKYDESRGRRRGPPRKSIAEEVSLRLVRTRRGSFSATLELPATRDQKTLWHAGEEALETVLTALESLSRGHQPSDLPGSAIKDINNLVNIVGDNVTKLTFRGRSNGVSHVAKFESRIPVAQAVPQIFKEGAVSGRLREVDFKDHTAELYDATGNMTRVRFGGDQEEDMRRSANLQVTISGDIEEDALTRRTTVQVSSISPVEVDRGFWGTPSLSELAESQGVSPLNEGNLNPAAFWPEDLVPDDFLVPILEERRRNRDRF